MFQGRENHVLKGATIKGKNMLPKVAPIGIEYNFKGH